MTKDERHAHVAKARLAAATRDINAFRFHTKACQEGLTQEALEKDALLLDALREFSWAGRLLQQEDVVASYANTLLAAQEPLKALRFLNECLPCGMESTFIDGIRSRLEAKVAHTASFEAYRAFYARPVIVHGLAPSNRNTMSLVYCQENQPKNVLCVGPNNAALEIQLLEAVPDMTITFAELASDFPVLAGSLAAAYPGRVKSHPMKDTYDWSEGPYDMIMCFEVVEHVPDANLALRALHKALAPNGTCFISVPDGPMSFDPTIPGAERFEHLRAFSTRSLAEALMPLFEEVNITRGDGSFVATCTKPRGKK